MIISEAKCIYIFKMLSYYIWAPVATPVPPFLQHSNEDITSRYDDI